MNHGALLAAAARHAGAGVARGRAALVRRFDGGYSPAAAAPGYPPVISLAGVTIGYGSRIAVEDVTGEFPPGSMTAIVGPNGAGKSTLLKALAGIVRPRTGSVSLGGARIGDLAYLPQADAVDRCFPVAAGEFVALGGWRRVGAFRPAAEIALDAAAALARVGLAEMADRPIAEMSVGQFRRILFARMSLRQARVLLLDEPFAAVDTPTTAELLELVRGWHRDGCTIIAALHDFGQVRDHFPNALVLARRAIGWGATAEALTPDNLARAGLDRG
jgi:zinc/manganese transport system ATP-binding protein